MGEQIDEATNAHLGDGGGGGGGVSEGVLTWLAYMKVMNQTLFTE